MIVSKTYNGQAGLNYIQSPDLSFATIIAVKREGIQYDKFISGAADRTYIFNETEGKISFIIPFSVGGERVFVLYKTTGVVPDTDWCTPVSISSMNLPGGRLVTPYIGTIFFDGTTPLTFSNIVAPSWANVFPFGTTRLRIVGIPDSVGQHTLSFDVTNCGATVEFSETINVYPFTNNLFVSRDYPTTTIVDVTLIDYLITLGSFPARGTTTVSAVHGDYTGRISVEVADILFPVALRLIVNGSETQSLAVTPDANLYLFAPDTYLHTDNILIVLN